MPQREHEPGLTPEFSRPVSATDLQAAGEYDFDISPGKTELAALAGLLDATAVRKVRFTGTIIPDTQDGFVLKGQIGATVIQRCVVTLAPVTTRIDTPVRRRFAQGPHQPDAEITIDPNADDEVDYFDQEIDLGLIAIETIALALPDFPRAPGAKLAQANFAAPGTQPMSDEQARPFSGLAALREKLKP